MQASACSSGTRWRPLGGGQPEGWTTNDPVGVPSRLSDDSRLENQPLISSPLLHATHYAIPTNQTLQLLNPSASPPPHKSPSSNDSRPHPAPASVEEGHGDAARSFQGRRRQVQINTVGRLGENLLYEDSFSILPGTDQRHRKSRDWRCVESSGGDTSTRMGGSRFEWGFRCRF